MTMEPSLSKAPKVVKADNFIPYNIQLVNADEEYESVTLPANCVGIEFKNQTTGARIRWAIEPGKVAGPTRPYNETNFSGGYYNFELAWANKILYFACGTANQWIELRVFVRETF